jgi:hypothetical protein
MRVFISYTAEDLKRFADVVQDVLRRMEWLAIDHRDWAPDGRPSVATCEQKVKSCDIVVVIVAHRYGWVPPVDQGGDGQTSITWMEYKWARQYAKPVVPYVVSSETNWPAELYEIRRNPDVGPRLDGFKSELRKGSAGFFTEDSRSLLDKVERGLLAAAALVGGTYPRWDELIRAGPPATSNAVKPEKLPYRCDRAPQASLLRFAVRQHVKSGMPRPLVCLVHGNSDEAHRPFVERVEGDTVPPLLAETPVGSQYRFIYLSRAEPARIDSFAAQVRAELSDKLLQYETEDDAGLVSCLTQRSRLHGLFCVLQLRASECGRKPAEVLNGIHRYWQAFPDLPQPLLIVCIVCLKLDEVASGLWDRTRSIFGGVSVIEQTKAAVVALEKSGRDDPSAPLYVLPGLRSVTLSDIDGWLTEARHWLPYVPEEQAKAVLDGRESAPMDEVIPRLEKLIKDPERA